LNTVRPTDAADTRPPAVDRFPAISSADTSAARRQLTASRHRRPPRRQPTIMTLFRLLMTKRRCSHCSLSMRRNCERLRDVLGREIPCSEPVWKIINTLCLYYNIYYIIYRATLHHRHRPARGPPTSDGRFAHTHINRQNCVIINYYYVRYGRRLVPGYARSGPINIIQTS